MNDRFKVRVFDKETKEIIMPFDDNSEKILNNRYVKAITYDCVAIYECKHNYNSNLIDFVTRWYYFDHMILMQCTGLKDKNNNLIYEGDLFTSTTYPFTDNEKPNYIGEVIWMNEFANFKYYLNCINSKKNGISERIWYLFEERPQDIVIIGNIHQNPELLKKKEY